MTDQWQPDRYDPRQHQQRLGQQQYPPQPPPGYGQPPYMPPQPPRRKPWPARHKVLTALFSAAALFVVIGIAAAAASPPSPSPAQPAPPAARTAAAPPAPPAAPVKPRLVAAFTGSGQQNTRRFTTTATWKLAYSFNCAAFGYNGNFMVLEDGSFGAMTVNDLAMRKTASSWAYNDAGTHYLEIDSECSWTMKVWDEG